MSLALKNQLFFFKPFFFSLVVCVLAASTFSFNWKVECKNIGFAFSGGGATIGQEAALLEALVKGWHPSGEKIVPNIVSGASAGSISAVAINGILKFQSEGKSHGWELFKSMLFNMSNSVVYDITFSGMKKIFTHNVFEGYILDNTPLRKLLLQHLPLMGFTNFGDLYIPTVISLVDYNTGLTVRLSSDDPRYKNLPLIDVLMASMAIPIVFQTQTVKGLNSTFIDGGTGNDMIPIFGLLSRNTVDEIYIIARQETTGTITSLPEFIQQLKLLANGIATIEDLREAVFSMALEEAKTTAIPCYSYIPDLAINFSSFDFDWEKDMYELTLAWAKQNNPLRLKK